MENSCDANNEDKASGISTDDVGRSPVSEPLKTSENDQALAAALSLATMGVLVFPCRRNKAPACPNGFKDATCSPESVKAFWQKYPRALVGVPTGAVNGIDALDLDPRNGSKIWSDKNRARLPATRTNTTKNGGQHLIFIHQLGLRNSAGKLAPGVDIRADGGYIIWWPALGLEVSNEKALPWPSWILRDLESPKIKPHSYLPKQYSDSYARDALHKAYNALVSVAEGSRNTKLNTETFTILKYALSGQLDLREIAASMTSAGLAAGLKPTEVANTVASAIRARGL